jgi:nicotinamidase-related amidase
MGFQGKMVSSALLVIDVQNEFWRTAPGPALADDVVARINVLAARARQQAAPVIFVQHEVRRGRPVHGSEGWVLVPELDVRQGDHTVRKTTPDSFLETGLGELLATLGVTHLVVCGYATEFCVDTTVRRAAALGYDVTLAADAHTTHDKPHASAAQIRAHHNATLPSITSFGPRIIARMADEIDFGPTGRAKITLTAPERASATSGYRRRSDRLS